MTQEGIIAQVQTVLLADATLSTYVKKVYLGVRNSVPDTNFPLIILEPSSNQESDEQDTNRLQRLTLKLLINAYVRVIVPTNNDLQIIGDSTHKGTMNLEKDIKVALGAVYSNLNGNCIWFKFINTVHSLDHWPIRGISIETHFYYQQDYLTRT